MDWIDTIDSRLIIISIFLYVVGMYLEKLPIFKKDWQISYVLWILGVLISLLYLIIMLNTELSIQSILKSIIQGTILSALAEVGKLRREGQKKKKEDAD